MPLINEELFNSLLSDSISDSWIDLIEITKKIKSLKMSKDTIDVSSLVQNVADLYKSLNFIAADNKVLFNDKKIILIEKSKSTLLEILYHLVNKNNHNNINLESQTNQNSIIQIICVVCGSLFSGLNGVNAGHGMLKLISGLSNKAALLSGLAVGALEILLFTGIEWRSTKHIFNVNFFKAKHLINAYKKQALFLNYLQKNIVSNRFSNELTLKDLLTCQMAFNLFQEDLDQKKDLLQLFFKDNYFRKITKYIGKGCSFLINFGSGIIFGKGLVGLFGGENISLPLSLFIGSVMGVISLVSYLTFHKKAKFNITDHLLGKPVVLKEMYEAQLNNEMLNQFNIELESIISGKLKNEVEHKILLDKIKLLRENILFLSKSKSNEIYLNVEPDSTQSEEIPLGQQANFLKGKYNSIISSSTRFIKKIMFFGENSKGNEAKPNTYKNIQCEA